jgi:type I site-specific restriction-modification system R (restriction) subunit/very-short-patch-repair endonuclease
MSHKLSEDAIEHLAIERLEAEGYSYRHGPDIAPDGSMPERASYGDVLLLGRVEAAVARLNPTIPHNARLDAIRQIQRLNSPDLLANNETFHRLLTEGVPIAYHQNGQERGDLVWLVDFDRPENNDYLVVNQFTVVSAGATTVTKRPDVILFVNGLPLVVIELKNAADENATISAAFRQLQTYKATIPSLFAYNSLLVISDGLEARAGSLSAALSRFMAWKTADGLTEASPQIPQLETLIRGMLTPRALLDLIRYFTVFEKSKVVEPSLSPSQREGSRTPLPLGGVGGGHYRGGLQYAGLVELAREMRKNQTAAEEMFWQLVKNRQFLGLKFRRQHQIGLYIVDFYCHSERLIIELDGGVHHSPDQRKKDAERDDNLTSLGNTVLRFENEELLTDPQNVLDQIAKSLSPLGRDGREGKLPYSWEGSGEGLITIETAKKIAAYHQYYAVNKAVESTLRAVGDLRFDKSPRFVKSGVLKEDPAAYNLPSVQKQPQGDRKAGVVWHTQGSGKSLSMVFYAGKIVQALNNPTIVVITDRNDLDDQLFDTFAAAKQLLRQEPVQAEDRDHLKALLKVASGGVVFTTIQKFQPEEGNIYETLSERENIVVIADEAHRTQYGFAARTIDEKDEAGNLIGKKVVYGFAKYLRDALPRATYLGFTGTPIEKGDVNTPAVFGNYVDIYDIAQAVEDGATVRIYYESRLAKIELSESGRKLVRELDQGLGDEELTSAQQAKAKWTQLEALVGSPARLKNVAQDIAAHFEQRQEVFEGKGMIVAMSRRIAAALYREIIALRPEWHHPDLDKGAVKVVMTAVSSDGPEIALHHTNKDQRRALAERMKSPDDPLKLVIVRDMWLTGFDVPALHTMYIDKPMKGHNLMQAIARVNRVYKDKPGGLIVDYLGIAADLKEALAFYSDSGGRGDPALLQEQAVSLMLEKLEVVSQMFVSRFDKSPRFVKSYLAAGTSQKLALILAAEDFILGLEDGRRRYINEVTALSQAFALAVPHEEAMDVKDEVAFFQAVKARLVKFDSSGSGRTDEEIETVIRQVIDQALVSEQVIDIYDAAGLKKPDISILSEEFLLEVQSMEHKNVALELLKKLLSDEIKARAKKNLVQSKKLEEMLEAALKRYHNKAITSAQIIEELIHIGKEVRAADSEAAGMGLTDFEYAFYTAVANNDSARELMQQEKLRELAVVLTERVRANTSIDWTIKESVRSRLKVIVKRTLRQYGYPPDMQKLATDTVLKQAELIAEELAS